MQLRRIITGITAPTLLLLAEPATPYLPPALMDARAACVAGIRVEHIAGPHHLHIRCARECASRVSALLG
jgi:hypothetical protein